MSKNFIKRHNALCAVLVFSLVFLFSSCRRNFISGYGAVASEHRTIDAFNTIVIEAPVHVSIKVIAGTPPALEIKGYKNLLSYIETKVRNGKLYIKVADGVIINTDENINMYISSSALNQLDVSGTANAEIEGNVNNQLFKLKVADAGDVLINNISTQKLDVHMSGAANLAVESGIVHAATYRLSEAANIKAYGLNCDDAEINVSGAGNIHLRTAQRLIAHISGAGNVSYKGHPQVSLTTSGAGILRDAN